MRLLLFSLLVSSLSAQSQSDPVALNNTAAHLQKAGDFNGAELSYLHALAAAQSQALQDGVQARIHLNLASLYKATRRPGWSARHYHAALAQQRGATPRERAVTINNLAEAERDAGHRNVSRLYGEALGIHESAGLPEDLDRAVLLHNLGVALAEEGRFHEAVAALRDSLAIKSRLFAGTDPQLALTRDNLDRVLKTVSDRRAAARTSRDTVDVLELQTSALR